MPCRKGTREQIEQSRRWYAEQRVREAEAEADPERRLWERLVDTVHRNTTGVDGLSEDEKLYFSVALLQGEVRNGGFEQFFGNTSGSFYLPAAQGLRELGAARSLELLEKAKHLIFGDALVPIETAKRRIFLRDRPVPSSLSDLDREFWEEPDRLDERLTTFARDRGLLQLH